MEHKEGMSDCAYEKPLMVALYLLVTVQPLPSAFDAALEKSC